MGKKIIIRGADFSQNGFHVTEVTKEYTKLKNYNGEDAVFPISAADGWYTCAYADNPGVLSLDKGYYTNAVSLGVNAEDYTHVKVEGFGNPLYSTALSCPIIACIDVNNNVLGGICIPDDSQEEAYINAGWTIVRKASYPSTFEMDIPVGTSKIYTTMVIPSQTNFKMTLSKIVIA